MTHRNALLTTSQVARRLSLSAERVRQLARSGRLPAAQETDLGQLWDAETVERFAATRGPSGRYVADPSADTIADLPEAA